MYTGVAETYNTMQHCYSCGVGKSRRPTPIGVCPHELNFQQQTIDIHNQGADSRESLLDKRLCIKFSRLIISTINSNPLQNSNHLGTGYYLGYSDFLRNQKFYFNRHFVRFCNIYLCNVLIFKFPKYRPPNPRRCLWSYRHLDP